MAQVMFVEPQDVDVLRKYLGSSDSGHVVLIYPSVHEHASALRIEDDTDVDYEFGGDADIRVDVVATPDHYFFADQTSDDFVVEFVVEQASHDGGGNGDE